MALFGAPVARENDPECAVRAGLAIRDWIAEEGKLQVRIAVNTGETLVNLDARPDSGEGMAAGDVVSTAARLQSVQARTRYGVDLAARGRAPLIGLDGQATELSDGSREEATPAVSTISRRASGSRRV